MKFVEDPNDEYYSYSLKKNDNAVKVIKNSN